MLEEHGTRSNTPGAHFYNEWLRHKEERGADRERKRNVGDATGVQDGAQIDGQDSGAGGQLWMFGGSARWRCASAIWAKIENLISTSV